MDFKDVGEVVSVGTTKAANERLAEGWNLLTVVGDRDGARYVFGRKKLNAMEQAIANAAGKVLRPVDE